MSVKHHKPKFLAGAEPQLDFNKFSEGEANYALGILEASQRKLQNPLLLISPLTAKEATVSSEIEGTQSTVSDVFLYEAGGTPEHKDTPQVARYREAMIHAVNELRRGAAIGGHLVKSLHAILLKDAVNKDVIGQYRRDRVWIGKRKGDPIEEALYIPPEAHLIQDYMDDLFAYLQKSTRSPLIKAAIVHYQFEAVHPFNDGNGRLGRLLIPLILINEKKLSSPILYLSGYFDRHRREYLDALHEVDETGQYEPWLAFCMHSVAEQLRETQQLIGRIDALYDETKAVFAVTKSPYLIPFVDFIFQSPIFTIKTLQTAVGDMSYPTASRLVGLFQEKGVILDLSMRKGHEKLYVFRKLLDLLQ